MSGAILFIEEDLALNPVQVGMDVSVGQDISPFVCSCETTVALWAVAAIFCAYGWL